MFFILVVAVIVVVIAYIVKSLSAENEERPTEELDVTFHPHAISRMEERDIDPDRVMELITGGGRMVRLAHHNRIKVSDGEITAVIGKGLRKLEVITVYSNNGQRDEDDEEE